MPVTVVLSKNSIAPSSIMLRSTTTPPGPDARASNSRILFETCVLLPKRSLSVSKSRPGAPAFQRSNPDLSKVHFLRTTSDASTFTSHMRSCPELSTITAILPARVLVNCTTYSPLPRSWTTPCSIPGPGADASLVDTINRAPPKVIRFPPRSRASRIN